jgi:hypothetical protein
MAALAKEKLLSKKSKNRMKEQRYRCSFFLPKVFR